MSQEQIYAAIPHRPPFLLVDEILEWADSQIVCEKTFTGEEDFSPLFSLANSISNAA